MFGWVLDKLLCENIMLQRAPFKKLTWVLDQPMLPIQCSSFWAIASAANTMVFSSQGTQTQGSLVKKLHLKCCIIPRSTSFQICLRRRSAENISFKFFKSNIFTDNANFQKVLEG